VPFDGVITARMTDIGALINAGASGPGQELFRLAAINTLRVYVAVSQVYAQAVRPGRLPPDVDDFQANPSAAPSRGTLTRSIRRRALCWSKWTWKPRRPASAWSLRARFTSIAERDSSSPFLPTRSCSVGGAARRGRTERQWSWSDHDRPRITAVLWRWVSGLQPTDQVIANPSDSLITGTPVRINAQQNINQLLN